MPATGAAFLSRSENIHNEWLDSFVTSNENFSSFGNHDCGMCDVPASALVRRSAVPEPSASCQKMPRSPSRSDWNAIRPPSADQIGYRFLPPKVRRCGEAALDKS